MTQQTPTEVETSYLQRKGESKLAYKRLAGRKPGIVFLGGFRSDMTGTKALALEAHARRGGHAFVRFDYFGHGQSDGDFTEGTIGLWLEDAIAVLDELTEGPQVLVGSSMGGWLMLLAALARPERVAALIGLAAAPDFTQDLMWDVFPEDRRRALMESGQVLEHSEYSEDATPITLKLIEEGRHHLLLRERIPIDCPVRLLHGMADPDVPWQTSPRLAKALASSDVEVTLLKDGDHRLSTPRDLDRLTGTLDSVIETLSALP